MNVYTRALNDIKEIERVAIAGLITDIEGLEQNPDITPFPVDENVPGKSASVFTISISSLDNNINMSPYFYDWKYQHQKIIDKIKVLSLNTSLKVLSNAVRDKFIVYSDNGRIKVPLHPKVVEQLKHIIEDENKS